MVASAEKRKELSRRTSQPLPAVPDDSADVMRPVLLTPDVSPEAFRGMDDCNLPDRSTTGVIEDASADVDPSAADDLFEPSEPASPCHLADTSNTGEIEDALADSDPF